MTLLRAKKNSADAARRDKMVSSRKQPVSNTSTYIYQSSPNLRLRSFCPCDGGCSRCASVVQTKLKIGQPNDIYEQEADLVADEIMRMPDTIPMLERADSQIQHTKEERPSIVQKDPSNGPTQTDNSLSFRLDNSPDTLSGKRPRAHELTHVLQQTSSQHIIQCAPIRQSGPDPCRPVRESIADIHRQMRDIESRICYCRRILQEISERQGTQDSSSVLTYANPDYYQHQIRQLGERLTQLQQQERELRERYQQECGSGLQRYTPTRCPSQSE